MPIEFDGLAFRKAIQTKRIIEMNVDLRTAALDLGISAATLHRCEKGKMPDLNTFACICDWLGEPPLLFHKKQKINIVG